jgi:predicted SAM-dependent methyltransferase
MKHIFSYTKVQIFIGNLIRTKSFFINPKLILGKEYLEVGCGPYPNKDNFINLDYEWRPGVDVCWDIVKKPYPFADNSFKGIYTEHCLEHIGLKDLEHNLKEFHRMLKSGGRLRIIVPDGELYCRLYVDQMNGLAVELPYQKQYISPMARINGLFRNHGHIFIHDFQTLKILLESCGFDDVKQCNFRDGVDLILLKDSEYRRAESLFLEAVKR